jgi:enediyne biosynthesis protein E4
MNGRTTFRMTLPISIFLAGMVAGGKAATFEEIASSCGLHYVQWELADPSNPPAESLGILTGGVATADSNGDGWPDLFVTRYQASDLLFINQGNGTFSDQSIEHGFTQDAPTNGVAWADADNDGDPDLYVSVATTEDSPIPSHYLYYENRGPDGYVEIGQSNGAALTSDQGHSGFSISFGDYDRDGWLDAHTCQWNPRGGNRQSILLRNRGDTAPGSFEDVTLDAGADIYSGKRSFAFSSCFSDMDRDGWPDLVIAGDFGTSRLFWNKQGRFIEGTRFARVATDENGMGMAIGDYDGDGLFDLFVTSIFDANPVPANPWGITGNRLFRNRGNRIFEDKTNEASVRDGAWGWGAAFFDYDNDGDLDLIMTNGYSAPFYDFGQQWLDNPMKLWRNDGDGSFTDVSVEEGITDAARGKGLSVFDYDKDGDLDVFVVNNASSPVLYRNNIHNGNHWLRVKPIGSYSNHDGIGCIVTLTLDDSLPEQVREISGGSNFLSQSEKVCHFGLGTFAGTVDSIEIQWPSGITQRIENVRIDQEVVVTEPVTPYRFWADQHFTQGDVGLAHADPDGDGWSNALEFATGLDPRITDKENPISIARAENRIQIIYRQRDLPRGVDVAVEVSEDLRYWKTSVDAKFESVAVSQSNDDKIQEITLRRSSMSAHKALWARLRVTIDE